MSRRSSDSKKSTSGGHQPNSAFPSIDAMAEMSVDELRILEKQYEKEASSHGKVSPNTIFAYATGLIRSQYKDDRSFGIDLLSQLDKNHPDRHRDCLYFLAIGYYKQDSLSKAKEMIGELLEIEPNNSQAQALESLIKKKMTNDGLIGAAIIGGAAALIVGLVFAFRGKH
jgi:fission 1 protein